MKALLRSLFDRYRAHHELGSPLLQWIGVVGCIAFPVLYVLRRMVASPPYDDLPWRLAAALLCLALAVRRWWPAGLRRFYIGYSYLVVFYCLSFLMSYTMLRSHGGTPAVINMLVGAVLVILLADWRNAIVMLVAGYGLAALAGALLDPVPALPREFIFAAGGSVLLVAGGALSHQGQKRVELQRMRRVYSGLAGSIAHEMRNPLAQVRHALDAIAATVAPAGSAGQVRLDAAQVQAVLDTVQQGRDAVSRGLQAIDLTLQQLQPEESFSRGQPRRVQALACAERAVRSYAYQDEGQRAKVRLDNRGDFSFQGDCTALELVLFNLLKNALYYLPLHPSMSVTVTVATEPSPRIVVRDTGPGIAPELLPHLFEEFQTVGKAEGTGLGLTFCRRVMRSLGGEISCRSELGAFTEFTLSLPGQPCAPAEAAAAALRGKTVLVVDDEALNRTIARELCSGLGLRVIEAGHGRQAVELLQSGTPVDFVLMDVNMPGLDGIQATRAIRALPGAAGKVPVVALTANESAAVKEAAAAAGMQAMLAKPLDPVLLARAFGHEAAAGADGQPAPGASAVPVLNARRLEDFRRLGMLEELLPESLAGLHRLVRQLHAGVAGGDAEGVKMALHTLVGLSGEAGAQALHALLRRRYGELLEGRLPPGGGWIEEVRSVLAATEAALLQQYGVRPAPPGDHTSSHSFRV